VNIKELELYKNIEEDKDLEEQEQIRAKFRLLRPFSKAYNILIYIYSSSAYIDYFKSLARRIILIDNYIR